MRGAIVRMCALTLLANFIVALPLQSLGSGVPVRHLNSSYPFFVQAVESSPRVASAAPQTADLTTLRKQGLSAYQQRDYTVALSIFRQVIAADPSDIVAYNVAGHCSFYLKDYPSAITAYKHALELHPDEYYNLGALIRTYTIAEMVPERDELRKHIEQLAEAGKLPDTFNYVFDTFDVGGKKVKSPNFPRSRASMESDIDSRCSTAQEQRSFA
jgi:tetratricopeptide (TPR) repeat protein